MARPVMGSQLFGDSGNAVQLFTTEAPRVLAITFMARAGNTEGVYVADDSAAKSAGIQLLAGDTKEWVFEPVAVRATSFWVWASDSGDRLDYLAVMED